MNGRMRGTCSADTTRGSRSDVPWSAPFATQTHIAAALPRLRQRAERQPNGDDDEAEAEAEAPHAMDAGRGRRWPSLSGHEQKNDVNMRAICKVTTRSMRHPSQS